MRDIPAVQGRPAGSSPWHWAGLVSAPMEWGIIAGRFVVVALLVLMVALVDDLAAARPAAFGASAVAVAYGSLLALALRAGRTRQVLLAGIGLDAITATAGLTLATFRRVGRRLGFPEAVEDYDVTDLYAPLPRRPDVSRPA